MSDANWPAILSRCGALIKHNKDSSGPPPYRQPNPGLRRPRPCGYFSFWLSIVAGETNMTTNIDSTFRALADPTRRRVIERLSLGPASMTELSLPFRITLPSLSRHLDILEASGLVRSAKSGRVRTYRLSAARLEVAEHWLAKQRSLWERRLDQLDEHLNALKEEGP